MWLYQKGYGNGLIIRSNYSGMKPQSWTILAYPIQKKCNYLWI